jgi:dihydroneopterin aldolase
VNAPALLASVRSAVEARDALAGGAEVIDAKDPATGALGALGDEALAQIVAAVERRCPTSATAGDLPFGVDAVAPAIARIARHGVDFVKVGLFAVGREQDLEATARRLRQMFPAVGLVAVAFADRTPRIEWLPVLAACGWRGAMLDTAEKRAGTLRDHLRLAELARFAQRARESDLMFGLAGSLAEADIDVLAPLRPDFLGFRGALTGTRGRSEALDPDAVARISARIRRARGAAASCATPAC